MTRTSNTLLTSLGIRSDLEELAGNLRWSWSSDGRALWERLAARIPAGRLNGHAGNPRAIVSVLSQRALDALAKDDEYVLHHLRVLDGLRAQTDADSSVPGFSHERPVAYFSMEFGLHESLPIYAGGLGILAGDHLKSSSDEGLPLVGVGLFYHKGYFRQELDASGRQKVVYPAAKLDRLPIRPAEGRSGKEIRVSVRVGRRNVSLRLWVVGVGRVPLYLLDSDLPENHPEDRGITQKLYGGTREDRIRQEIVAGIGGVRALKALGIQPGVWHLNEGHVAFLTLERIRELRRSGLSFKAAVGRVAADTVFTTHTPVPEGNEEFAIDLARRYLAPHARAAKIPVDDYLALGLEAGRDGRPSLSMTVLAMRLSSQRNGVSKLHGRVSRRMWAHLWPERSPRDVPIDSVTNGIHTTTWVAPGFDRIFSRYLGEDWTRHLEDRPFWRRLSKVPEGEIFATKQELKRKLVDFVRKREDERLTRLGMAPARRKRIVQGLLDPDALTIGFARRFALYKRAALLFRDLKRAARLFGNRKRPVQIIFAGKPHPEDPQGRELFETISRISRMKEFRGRVVLLENYDIEMCRHLVQGVDVWLNNPRRPQEASGTSGQKVPVNGGLNVSILDGWWCEGYSPKNGWAFGKTGRYDDLELQDREDFEDLYRVLEREVVSLYCRRDRNGVPTEWFRKVKSSMSGLIPRFSTSHMVLEYARRLYSPALQAGKAADSKIRRRRVASTKL